MRQIEIHIESSQKGPLADTLKAIANMIEASGNPRVIVNLEVEFLRNLRNVKA
jgi:hypothetical protein